MRRTTQPSTIGGPLGESGFCFFCSTVMINVNNCTLQNITQYESSIMSLSKISQNQLFLRLISPMDFNALPSSGIERSIWYASKTLRMLLNLEAGVTRESCCSVPRCGGRCNQGGGDVTRNRSDGRPVWLEMPRQQCHRYISVTHRKNTELL